MFLIDTITNFLFPKVCGICKNKINKNYTCEKCSNILKYTMERELCVRKSEDYVDLQISLFTYRNFIRSKILEMKFDGKAYISSSFAECMCKILKDKNIEFDIIIPVPIHPKRYMERGYNQSELLSRFISREFKVKNATKILFKVKNNVPQSTLNQKKRIENVINAYKVKKNKKICGKKILLIDDIYTTGATANECAKILKKNGASKVICFTIAYGKL